MVSFFGEVVFPVSRAFWDEEDENESDGRTINETEFSVQWLKEKSTQIDTLILVEGEMLIDFSRECLCQSSEEVCLVEDESKRKICIVYQVNNDIYLCVVSPRFDVKLSGKLVDKISDILLNVKNTICITSRHMSQFKCKDVPTVPSFLRMLTTKNGGSICSLKEPPLEQPNIVYGVTAGVLSYAEFMELPSVLYVLYTDNFVLDSVSAEPLLKLFTAMNCTVNNVTFTGKNFFNKGNLYMYAWTSYLPQQFPVYLSKDLSI
ncbi:PREDICTED: proteasome assembly chaperone 1 [Dufourea novaeangliae]|uniref:Proteasome assembly chaperone 1 n=1 Tax=Dufourea novaeangliae TaxID=178035 RepID=A0A154P2Y6_DUFNO|nr:PREDICTED: proteasome assembly chaperone 1 [Dufourea novaeangliae]KZC06193.1 Proteasome assembly chaperone 1 [Dufourea novaeangliae]